MEIREKVFKTTLLLGLEVQSTPEGKGMFQGYKQEDRLKATLRPAGPLLVLYTGSPEEKLERPQTKTPERVEERGTRALENRVLSVSLSWSPLCL